jgi:DNA invertase Pin-like site-specific DNA recombinase
MTKAAIYARFSSDLQRDRSIEDQIESCRAYAERQGFDVVEVYADRAKSGASMHGRDGIQRLISDGRQRLFDVVVVETLSRLARDEGDRAEIRKRLTFAGVKTMTPSDGEVTRLTDGIKAIIDAQYLEDLKVMVRRGMAGVTRDGRHAGGRAYGYRPILGKPGELEIVDDEAAIIRRIFAEYAAGKMPRAICAALNAEGVKPPRGTYWSDGVLRGNRVRGHGILVNPIYSGEIVWNRVRMVKDPDTGKRVSRQNPVDEWQRAAAPHLAIVDQQTFATVQAKLGDIGKAPAWKARRPKGLFAGLLQCGCCGAGMSIKDRSAGRVRIHCAAARQGACTNTRTEYLDTIEPVVLDGLKARLKDKAAIALYLRTYNDERRALALDSTKHKAQLDRRLASVQGQLDRAIGLVIKGLIGEDDAAADIARLKAERAEITAQLASVGEKPKVIELHPAAVTTYLDTVDRLEVALREGSERDHPAAEPIRALIDRIVITPGAAKIATVRVEGKLNALIGGEQFPAMRLGVISGSGGGI